MSSSDRSDHPISEVVVMSAPSAGAGDASEGLLPSGLTDLLAPPAEQDGILHLGGRGRALCLGGLVLNFLGLARSCKKKLKNLVWEGPGAFGAHHETQKNTGNNI